MERSSSPVPINNTNLDLKTIIQKFCKDFVLLAWNIRNDFWYIPVRNDGPVFTNNLDSLVDGLKCFVIDNVIRVYCSEYTAANTEFELIMHKYYAEFIINYLKYESYYLTSHLACTAKPILNNLINSSELQQVSSVRSLTTELVNYILDYNDFNKLLVGAVRIKKELFDLYEMIESVIKIANVTVDVLDKKINILHYIEKSVPQFIYSDLNRLKQILVSLLDNAIRYTNDDVILYITSDLIRLSEETTESDENEYSLYLSEHQYSITFSVKDHGVGIEEEKRIHLLDPTINKNTKGLSLKVSAMLSSLLNGKLTLSYSEIGKGSCFKLEIIVVDDVINQD
jgi:signal transduction histidine kinase